MKYTIIHVNDRAKEQIAHNKNILSSLSYVDDIEFFNAHEGNAWDVLNHKGIRQDVWAPYDGRSFDILKGEQGIWVSTINCLEYASSIEEPLLVLEDDVILEDDFYERLVGYMAEVPDNFDFLSLHYFIGDNWVSEDSECGLKHLHKSIHQYSGAQAMVYSPKGARRILRLIKQRGIEYTSDCFIFNKSMVGALHGYSIKPEESPMLKHNYKEIKSLIDPENSRMVEM